MDHSDIRRNLSAYLDNALGSEQKEHIKRHLGMCGSCREALADLEWTVGQFRLVPEVEPPLWLTARIMANLQVIPAPAPGVWRRLFFPLRIKLPLGAAAIALVCMTGYYFARTRTAPLGRPTAATAPSPGIPPVPSGQEAPPPLQGRGTAPLRQFTREELPSGPQPAPAAIPAPAVQVAPSPQEKEAPAISDSPALPEPSRHEPGLQPAGEWPAIGREKDLPFTREAKGGQRKAAGKNRSYGDGTVAAGTERVGEADVTLEVKNPAAAGKSIEREVGSVGGTIRGDSSSDGNHLLLVQIDARKLSTLLDRLAHIGDLNERPAISGEGKVILSISW
jgi:Putative zinc-finger/Predicted integral membrane protein (DUF2275)